MTEQREICPHEKLGHHVEVTIIGIGTVKLCDDCRRKLCTCGTCTAFDPALCNGDGFCKLRPSYMSRRRHEWCLSWRQARPWELEETLARLGEGE